MFLDLKDVDILEISEEARNAKNKDKKTINATLGILLDEEGVLYSIKSVDEVLSEMNMTLAKSYFPQDGGILYKRSLLQYLFKTEIDDILGTFHTASTFTAGGSGALSLAFDTFAGTVILPNLRWNEYDLILESYHKSKKIYSMFKENKFNIESLEECIKSVDDDLIIVINDPAHNPTGYTLKQEEHSELIRIINHYSMNKNITVLYDIAYVDYSEKNYEKTVFHNFIHYNENVNILIAFSGSKSFGVYGFRMGALIYLNKSESKTNAIQLIFYDKVSAIYGAPFSPSVMLLNEIIHKNNLKSEQTEAYNIIVKRAYLFIEEAASLDIPIYPYVEGFFITVITLDPVRFTELLKKHKVYVIPTENGIRIALSAINLEEVKRIVKIIKKVSDELDV